MKNLIFASTVAFATILVSCNSGNNEKKENVTLNSGVVTIHNTVGKVTSTSAVIVSSYNISQKAAQQTLTIKNGKVPAKIKIIEGNSFIFPRDLASYGMKLIKTSSGYILKDTTKAKKNVPNPKIDGVVINGSIENVIISNSSNFTITDGKLITNDSSIVAKKTLVITVPKSTKVIIV